MAKIQTKEIGENQYQKKLNSSRKKANGIVPIDKKYKYNGQIIPNGQILQDSNILSKVCYK